MPAVTGAALLERVTAAAVTGVDHAAQFLTSEVQGSAPVGATGALRAGIHATPAVIAGTTVEATVASGSETDDYAVVQEVGYWVNFRGKYGYVAVKAGAPHFFQANVEGFGAFLTEYVRASVAGAL